jgi:hypothetical protein
MFHINLLGMYVKIFFYMFQLDNFSEERQRSQDRLSQHRTSHRLATHQLGLGLHHHTAKDQVHRASITNQAHHPLHQAPIYPARHLISQANLPTQPA